MAISFPTSIDVLTNPTATDQVATVAHSSQHANANDAIEALEAKVGVDGSAVTTTHDYKLSEVTVSDKAVGKTATQTLTNKTLTTPTIGDLTNANHTHEGVASGGTLNATNVFSAGTIPTARLGSGTANSTTYLRGDQTWQTVSDSLPTAVTVLPQPIMQPVSNSTTTFDLSQTTTMGIGLYDINQSIEVNKLTYHIGSFTSNGTFKIGIYTNDGATRILNLTTATFTSTGMKTETLGSPLSLSAGQYYFTALLNTGLASPTTYIHSTGVFGTGVNTVSGKGLIVGSYSVTPGTLPTTITPTSIGDIPGGNPQMILRLDN